MAKSQNSEVEKAKANEVAISRAFEQDAQAGFEKMGQDDLALPFMKILTNMSPEIGEVDGASPGMLYNSVTNELYSGEKGVVVIPCAYFRQYIEWEPRGQGSGAPINIHPATSDILSKTHRESGENKDYLENGNYVENTANHYVMVLDNNGVPNPALIVMKSTQLKKSRKWNSMMMSVKLKGAHGHFTPPMFSQQYRLTVVSESSGLDPSKLREATTQRRSALSPFRLVRCRLHPRATSQKVQTERHTTCSNSSTSGLRPRRSQ